MGTDVGELATTIFLALGLYENQPGWSWTAGAGKDFKMGGLGAFFEGAIPGAALVQAGIEGCWNKGDPVPSATKKREARMTVVRSSTAGALATPGRDEEMRQQGLFPQLATMPKRLASMPTSLNPFQSASLLQVRNEIGGDGDGESFIDESSQFEVGQVGSPVGSADTDVTVLSHQTDSTVIVDGRRQSYWEEENGPAVYRMPGGVDDMELDEDMDLKKLQKEEFNLPPAPNRYTLALQCDGGFNKWNLDPAVWGFTWCTEEFGR